jgi:DNA-directed RNA polymerase subunit RPC12/RpoP
MGQKQTGRYCAHCKSNIMATGNTPNHLLHLVLSFFSFGLWIPVWILVSIGRFGGYRCTQCGSRV